MQRPPNGLGLGDDAIRVAFEVRVGPMAKELERVAVVEGALLEGAAGPEVERVFDQGLA